MTYDQIRSKVYLLTKTNVNSLTNANLNLYTQPAEDRIATLIMKADSRWQFDDSNYTDLPIATTALTSGQQDYSIATAHLTIERVEIKDSGGIWRRLLPIDQQQLKGGQSIALDEYYSSNGVPIEYDTIGNSVFLYPAPNFTQEASLKLYFLRGAKVYDYDNGQFANGDAGGVTTTSPGFNSLFHNLIALWASFEFAIANGLQNANQIFAEITRTENELNEFYGNRQRDERPRFTVGQASTGVQSGRLSTGGNDSNR